MKLGGENIAAFDGDRLRLHVEIKISQDKGVSDKFLKKNLAKPAFSKFGFPLALAMVRALLNHNPRYAF